MTYKKIIYLIIGIILLTQVNATMTIYWETPSKDAEIISDYPQNIKALITSTNPIQNCTVNVSYQPSKLIIIQSPTTSLEITREFKLSEGTYTTSINCKSTSEEITESKTFSILDMLTFQEKNNKDRELTIYAIITTFLLIIYFIIKNKWIETIISGLILILSMWIITEIEYLILWIPILTGALLFINSLLKIIGFKR